MSEASLGLALAAGMLAAVNPCGFALLPAYLSFLILGDGSRGRAPAVLRALVLTAAMTSGFAAVFGVFGLLIAPVAGSIQQHVPWFTIGLGLLLVVLGGLLLAGRTLPTLTLRRTGGGSPVTGSVPSMIGFGASYAIASLGCTIPPFLAIVASSFQTESAWTGIGLFVAYAGGMGVVVGVAAVAVALARGTLVGRLRRFGAVMPRLAGGLLVLVGAYVGYYGWYEVRAFRGDDVSQDPIIGFGESVQSGLTMGLSRVGAVGIAIILAAVVTATILGHRLRR